MMREISLLLLIFLPFGVFGQETAFPESILADDQSFSAFILYQNEQAAPILVDPNDQNTVLLAAKLFAEDLERVTGTKPPFSNSHLPLHTHESPVIIGSIESSDLIQELIRTEKLDVSDIAGDWEACITEVITNPFPGVDKALVIAGSDRRGTAYGVFELSKQIGVSPWYWFADVPIEKKSEIRIKRGKYKLKSPSVKYRGIFINDEMWGLRPWAMFTYAPEEGKGLGPKTYARIFELMLRLKANLVWPAMHQKTKPFNYYPENRVVADEYGIVMGSSHIEPMLRNNIGGAEWDTEYPDEPWDYIQNKKHIYQYWEDRVKENGQYENMYTLGKRGKDDHAGSDGTVEVIEEIISDQRNILGKWVNPDVTKVPQVLIAYTEVLNLYNQGMKVPDDIILCWPDDNFGNIRQLPNDKERERSGGSGVYYHFQWLNGATTAYPWLCTTPIGLTGYEMKKAYDFGVDQLWVVNVGDIKPAEINIEYFMQLAWDIDSWDHTSTFNYLQQWAEREFGKIYAEEIAILLTQHYELGYARRPESLVLWNGREQKLSWEWFSTDQYDDEAQRRIDVCNRLIKRVERIYKGLPLEMKDAFLQMVMYNVKGAALQNLKVLYAQKSHTYGQHKRASAARYGAKAEWAEQQIYELIHQYNREQETVGDKWDHMASLPGPWGGQWHQWDMPPLSSFSGEGVPHLEYAVEGADSIELPGFSVFNKDSAFIDLFNTGNGVVYWSSETSNDWIQLSENSGVVYDEQRIWVTIDYDQAPQGEMIGGAVKIFWSSSMRDEWADWDQLSIAEREDFRKGITKAGMGDNSFKLSLSLFNPDQTGIKGFVESNGYISIEAEHFSRRIDHEAAWDIIEGLGRSGNSVSVFPVTLDPLISEEKILISSPSIEYDIHLFSSGAIRIQLNCVPSLPINADYRQRVAVAIDDQPLQVIAYQRGARSVMDNLMTLEGNLQIEKPGAHVLRIFMVDPGVVIDQIILDTGGVKESYLGPPESNIFGVNE